MRGPGGLWRATGRCRCNPSGLGGRHARQGFCAVHAAIRQRAAPPGGAAVLTGRLPRQALHAGLAAQLRAGFQAGRHQPVAHLPESSNMLSGSTHACSVRKRLRAKTAGYTPLERSWTQGSTSLLPLPWPAPAQCPPPACATVALISALQLLQHELPSIPAASAPQCVSCVLGESTEQHQRLQSVSDQDAKTARSAEGDDSLKKSRWGSTSTGSTLLHVQTFFCKAAARACIQENLPNSLLHA